MASRTAQDMGQDLVLDLNQLDGFFGNVKAGGSNSRNRMALIEDLAMRHDLLAGVVGGIDGLPSDFAEGRCGHDGFHTGQGFGSTRVDGDLIRAWACGLRSTLP